MYTSGVPYPATFTFDPPEKIANWRPLVNWILAIPHLLIAQALGYVSQALAFVSWLLILFTGKVPQGITDFQAMYLRYTYRAYTYAAFMREEYPPFAFGMTAADPGDDPRVRVDLQPALEERNRVTTAFRLILAIPHFVALAVLVFAALIVLVIAFFAVLFTGRWPSGLRDFVLGVGRWSVRFQAYLLLLTDEYPPFSLD
jgi:hypothetical protein